MGSWRPHSFCYHRSRILAKAPTKYSFIIMQGHRSIRGLLSLLLLTVICGDSSSMAESGASSASSSSEGAEQVTSTPAVPSKSLEPVVLTTVNFEKNIGDGSRWLVEFYAPWCSHCMSFAPTYSEIARHFHSNPQLGVKVGKIDTTVQKALGQRFDLQAYPSFFLISGSSVFEYDDARSKASFIKFATTGYKQQAPIPFYSSPMGPLGRLQGLLIWGGVTLMSFFSWVQNASGLSPLLTGCLLCGLAVFGGMFSMILLVVVFTPSDKPHRD